ncbi:MAG: RHS repeat-associated core domain-containing protein, partial [Ignavibacteria bacterium]
KIARSTTSAGINVDEKFTGKELDDDNNERIYYFGTRYYDGDLGKWRRTDPMSHLYPGESPYNYTSNSPLNRIDPSGMDWFENDETGELRFIRGISSIEGDQWNNIGGDDLYQDWLLDDGSVIGDLDEAFLATDVAQRLMYTYENNVLVSEQDVIENSFVDSQKEPELRRTGTSYRTDIIEEKFTYVNLNKVIERNEGRKETFKHWLSERSTLSSQRVRYQTIIKVGQTPYHPNRKGRINSTETINFILYLIGTMVNK